MFQPLVTAGVTPSTPPHLAKRLRLTNRAALTLLATVVPLSAAHIAVQSWPGLLVVATAGVFLALVIALNHIGWTQAGRALLYGGLIVLYTGAAAVFSLTSGIVALFVTSIPLPFVLLEPGSRQKPSQWALTMALAGVGSYIYFGPSYTPYAPPSAALTPIYMLIAAAFGVAQVYWLHRENNLAEARLQATVDELAVARAAAERASDAKSTFVAFLSHEIRNPLGAIIGLTDLSLMQPMEARQRGLLQQVRSSSEHLLHLLNDVLDLSRVEAGHLLLNPQAADVRTIVEESAALLAVHANATGVALELELELGLTEFREVDATRLKQVLLNLIGNAVKFTPRGGRVRVEAEVLSGTSVLFSVRDDGPGMTKEVAERVFLPWEQGDRSVPQRFGGSGLGLHISRHLVEALGGTLQLETHPGLGTRFWFRLDLAPAIEVDTPILKTPASRRLLVAIADPEQRGRTTRRLSSLGHQVNAVSDAASALVSWRPGYLDAVVLDSSLSDLDAVTVCRSLRTVDEDVCIIIASLVPVAGLEQAALDAGADLVCALPLPQSALNAIATKQASEAC